jgi:hypothetical protein
LRPPTTSARKTQWMDCRSPIASPYRRLMYATGHNDPLVGHTDAARGHQAAN